MALFDSARTKKAAEDAKKAAEEAARIAKAQANLARNTASQQATRADKAEKELQEMKAAEASRKVQADIIAKRQAAAASVKPASGTGGPLGGFIPGTGIRVTPTAQPSAVATYTVKKGDTLGAIAKQFYGVTGPKYWNLIQAANKDIIKDVNVISPGQVFKIPALPEELKKK
jgi:nucleoid-associated protein YgaU